MTIVAGVRFKPAGKVYYFDPGDLDLPVDAGVIVETARGLEYGTVVVAPRDVPDDQVVQPLKQVIRCATEADMAQLRALQARNEEAMVIARERIAAHGLDMHLVEVESTFDASKLIFQFTAEQRVDFRELVRDLASRFRTRIELRQIGVRDEAKLLGGIGMCGRELCCSTWMTEFMPVSIRMAKDQNLSLNPAKISGVCGRLLCCLRFELDPDAKGKSHQELAAEPSVAELELAEALQEDILAAVESAPTRDDEPRFTAVSMPRPREALPEVAATDVEERPGQNRPRPLKPPRPATAGAAPSEAPGEAASPAGQPRSRRRRRGRRGGASATAKEQAANKTEEQPQKRPRRRSRRRTGQAGSAGNTAGPSRGAGSADGQPET